MFQKLRVLVVLREAPYLALSTHTRWLMITAPVPRDLMPFVGLLEQPHICGMYVHIHVKALPFINLPIFLIPTYLPSISIKWYLSHCFIAVTLL